MKFSITLSVILAGLVLWSCSGGSSGSRDESAAADTVVARLAEEPTQPELLVTPDLTLLEVKGNVKEIKGKEADNYVYGGNAKFDENGKLTHYGHSDPIDKLSNVKRDSDGRLTDFLASEWMTVKWNGERPSSVMEQYNELSETYSYKYGDNGLVVEITHRSQDEIEETDDTQVATVVYPDDAFDPKDNWVKRIVKYPGGYTETQVREILYY